MGVGVHPTHTSIATPKLCFNSAVLLFAGTVKTHPANLWGWLFLCRMSICLTCSYIVCACAYITLKCVCVCVCVVKMSSCYLLPSAAYMCMYICMYVCMYVQYVHM